MPFRTRISTQICIGPAFDSQFGQFFFWQLISSNQLEISQIYQTGIQVDLWIFTSRLLKKCDRGAATNATSTWARLHVNTGFKRNTIARPFLSLCDEELTWKPSEATESKTPREKSGNKRSPHWNNSIIPLAFPAHRLRFGREAMIAIFSS